MNIFDAKKIIILGNGGSGKSWIAERIAEITNYPCYHLDHELWKQNWVRVTEEEESEWHDEVLAGENWIIEGNYSGTIERRFAAADLIIFLDINQIVCILSAMKRRGRTRSELQLQTTKSTIFNKESLQFIKWQWNFRKSKKLKILALCDKYPKNIFLHIKSRRDANKLLTTWRNHNENRK